jgi:hypothetical protein
MDRLRNLTIVLLAAALAAGCASEKAEQRRARAPLRDVFPPPTLDASAAASPAPGAATENGSGAPAAVAAAGAATGAAVPGAAAGADVPPPAAPVRQAAEEAGPTSAPAAAGTTAALKPPRDAGGDGRSLAPPALDEEAPSAREAPLDDALAPRSLEKEFESAPAAAAPATSRAASPSAGSASGSAAAAPAVAAAAPSTLSAQSPATVPRIVVSSKPALLVSISGKPAYGPIEGTQMQRVLNTPAFLVKSSNGKYYLSVYDGFMTAATLTGPWTVVKTAPAALTQAKARALTDGESDVLAGRPDPLTGQRPTLRNGAPRIVVATQPTALLVIRGEPLYEPVDGTRLSRLTNTDARVFVNRPEDRTYVQIGERWYRAPSLKGPWEAVDPARLPEGLDEAAGSA